MLCVCVCLCFSVLMYVMCYVIVCTCVVFVYLSVCVFGFVCANTSVCIAVCVFLCEAVESLLHHKTVWTKFPRWQIFFESAKHLPMGEETISLLKNFFDKIILLARQKKRIFFLKQVSIYCLDT